MDAKTHQQLQSMSNAERIAFINKLKYQKQLIQQQLQQQQQQQQQQNPSQMQQGQIQQVSSRKVNLLFRVMKITSFLYDFLFSETVNAVYRYWCEHSSASRSWHANGNTNYFTANDTSRFNATTTAAMVATTSKSVQTTAGKLFVQLSRKRF